MESLRPGERRRSALGVSTAVLAMVAVIATAGWASGRHHDRPDASTTPQTESPSPVSASSPTTNPTAPPADPTVVPDGRSDVDLTLAGLPTGRPASVSWLQGQTVHLADGTTAPIPASGEGASYLDAEPHAGGWIAVYEEANGSPVMDEIDAAGSAHTVSGGSETFAVKLDGSAFAWNEIGQSTLMVSSTSPGATPDIALTMAKDSGNDSSILTPVGWTDPDHLVYDSQTGPTHAYITDVTLARGHGHDDGQPIPGALGAASTSEATGMVAVSTISSGGKCERVQSLDGLVVAFSTCDYFLGQFSDDGRYILANPLVDSREVLVNEIVVLDATNGDVVVDAHWSRKNAAMSYTWDRGTDSVLVEITDLVSRAEPVPFGMVRIGLDGSLVRVPGVDPAGTPFVRFLTRG